MYMKEIYHKKYITSKLCFWEWNIVGRPSTAPICWETTVCGSTSAKKITRVICMKEIYHKKSKLWLWQWNIVSKSSSVPPCWETAVSAWTSAEKYNMETTWVMYMKEIYQEKSKLCFWQWNIVSKLPSATAHWETTVSASTSAQKYTDILLNSTKDRSTWHTNSKHQMLMIDLYFLLIYFLLLHEPPVSASISDAKYNFKNTWVMCMKEIYQERKLINNTQIHRKQRHQSEIQKIDHHPHITSLQNSKLKSCSLKNPHRLLVVEWIRTMIVLHSLLTINSWELCFLMSNREQRKSLNLTHCVTKLFWKKDIFLSVTGPTQF